MKILLGFVSLLLLTTLKLAVAQDCDSNEFVIKNGDQTFLRIDENADIHACGTNVCERLESGVQQLVLNGDQLSISNGNMVQLPDASSSNELQSLSLLGSVLSLSGSNSVNLDDSASSLSAGMVSLTGGNQCFPPSTFFAPNFTHIAFDLQSEWNSTIGSFVLKKTGIYMIIAQCFVVNFEANAHLWTHIYTNGALSHSRAGRNINLEYAFSQIITTFSPLNAGDTLRMECRHLASTEECLNGEFQTNFFAIIRLR